MVLQKISPKARAILDAIAKGHSYEQILSAHSDWTYQDIFRAAAKALDTGQQIDDCKTYSITEIRLIHPRAYEKWDTKEEARLKQLHNAGPRNQRDCYHIAATIWRHQ